MRIISLKKGSTPIWAYLSFSQNVVFHDSKFWIKILIICSLIAMSCACSERDDDGMLTNVNCERVGQMFVQFNDTLEIDYQRVIFETPTDSTIDILCTSFSDDCLTQRYIFFLRMDRSFEQQTLEKLSEDSGSVNKGTMLGKADEDVLIESFYLFEDEPRWLRFTEIGEKEIKGRFQATYVTMEEGDFTPYNLLDTLRFNNVEFTAKPYQ